MDLYIMNEEERRILCKQTLETLEYWLRRLIDDVLSKQYGANYIEATDKNGNFIINTAIRKKIQDRMNLEPDRYPRLIDATLLEHQIDIICNPSLYNLHFAPALKTAFPEGRDEARTFLKRLEYPRNCLYHANALSVRQSEQVVCYSHDVIDSIKEHHIVTNQGTEFNVPKILKITDSFGNVHHFNDPSNNGVSFTEKKECYLRPGDTLTIEAEVDPTFQESEYSILWRGGNTYERSVLQRGKKLLVVISELMVSARYPFRCDLTTNKTWHKHDTFDDQVSVAYKILPPS
jgi:hypothetical protein